MGWRFRKSFKIMPGVRVNVGKKGVSSFTFGPRGATISKGKRGTYANIGIRGTGLSYRTKISGAKSAQQQQKSGCLPTIIGALVFLFLVGSLNSCFNKSSTNARSNSQAVPAVKQQENATRVNKGVDTDFVPIPYEPEPRKIVKNPTVSDFEKEIAQKHKEAEVQAQTQQNAQETRDKVKQWRESDEQTRRLLSNNSGSSSSDYGSYYSPPSSNYAPSRDKSVSVQGYYRKDGTYVQPHTRSRPN